MAQLSHKIGDPSRSGKLYTKNVSLGTDGRRLAWVLISGSSCCGWVRAEGIDGAGATLLPLPAPPRVQVLLWLEGHP